jgi:dipeptidyl-peptidase-4
MADDNVLFTNTTILFKELQKAGIVYESITYPGAKHGIYGKQNQIHLYTSIADFLERRLK